MRLLVLLHQDERVWAEADEAERERYYAQHEAFDAALRDAGVEVLAGEALQGVRSATTFRRRDGVESVVDGPFAETAEQLGGFYLVEAPDIATVVGLLGTLPEYTLEVRPVAQV